MLQQEKIWQKDAEVSSIPPLTGIDPPSLPLSLLPSLLLPLLPSFSSSQVNYRANEADWSRDMRGKHLITPVGLRNFFILSTGRDQDKAVDFYQTLQKVGPAMGIEVNNRCQTIRTNDDRTDTFLRAIRDNLTEKTQMVCMVAYLWS